jgi:hypothetical protein
MEEENQKGKKVFSIDELIQTIPVDAINYGTCKECKEK